MMGREWEKGRRGVGDEVRRGGKGEGGVSPHSSFQKLAPMS